jgi:LAO/AO transport system kinase
MNLVDGVLKGHVRDIARLISVVENELPEATNAMQEIFPHTGNAYTVGFTGPPGAGKSTLVDKVTLHLCQQGKKTGIVAIDPSSPFSGGAILGDRIRMRDVITEKDVFIRSLSTRGSMGGLSRAAGDIAKILDASGKTLCSSRLLVWGRMKWIFLKLLTHPCSCSCREQAMTYSQSKQASWR